MSEVCSLFGVTKQAYYKYDEQSCQTLLLRDKIAVDYALRIRAIDPRIGCKKLYLMYSKEFSREHPLGRDHFLRLLEQRGLKLRRRQSGAPRTTDSRHHYPTYPNRIRSVIPQRANRIWVSDITYIKVWDNMDEGLPYIYERYTKDTAVFAVLLFC